MKIKLMKVFMPLVVITLGIFGAISTSAMNQKSVAFGDRWGYNHIEGEGCVQDIMCSTIPGDLCKTESEDKLYDLEEDGISCRVQLFKKQ